MREYFLPANPEQASECTKRSTNETLQMRKGELTLASSK